MYSLVVLDNETTFTNPIQSPNIEDLHRAFLVGMRQMRHGLLLCWAGLSLQGCHDPHDVRMPIGHAVQRWQNKNLVSFLETHQEDRTKFIFRSVFWRKNQGLLYHTTAWPASVSSRCPLEDVQLQRRGLLGWFEQPWLVSAVVGYVKWCLGGNRSSFSVFAAAIMLGNRLMP